jgi:transcriptional regulator with XRE-family HTH domain
MARTKKAVAEHPRLSVHQVVAYNFRRARESLGWTQAETGERLAPYLGLRLNQAGVSAIEKTYDSDRKRNIDVAEIVAFARCFGLPITWFFIPPLGRAADWVEPADEHDPHANLPAGDLVALALGSPAGSDAIVPRIVELLRSDSEEIRSALSLALAGERTARWEKQIHLRRQALLAATLVERTTPGEEIITKMAELLIELVKLTPIGFDQLRRSDPDEALRLLAEGDELVQPALRSRHLTGELRTSPSADGFRDLEPIDVQHAFDPDEQRS